MLRFAFPIAGVCLVNLLLSLAPGQAAAAPAAEELASASQLAASLAAGVPAELPFSFTYGGRRSSELLTQWQRSEKTEDRNRTRTHVTTWRDPKSGLELRAESVEYLDFPVAEWTLYFRNTGTANSPLLENVRALDWAWQPQAAKFLLHHAAGSQANKSDYAPRETPLPPGASKRLAGAGGRPTNVDWSYFNIQAGDEGRILAVGWPGQWAAEIACDPSGRLRVQAGQERLSARLLPGEEIRTPSIVVLCWRGEYLRSQNLWRRWMLAHSMPRPGGQLPPPQFVASSSRAYEEMIKADQQNQIMHIDRYLEEGLKIDYWWMDAGWYIQQHGWPQVGTWEVDPKRFPRGFRPISDHAHAKGVKILVWFEPERVMPGTWLYQNRPEWLLSTHGSANPLAGLRSWSASDLGGDPCVNHNSADQARTMANIRWEPGRLSFHPGSKGEYSVVRWTAPQSGPLAIDATFLAIDRNTTTDVHVLQSGRPIWNGWVRLQGQGEKTHHAAKVTLAKGETLDFVVGWGNGSHVCDSTGLEVRLTDAAGKVHDAAREFLPDRNPAGPWSYGCLKPGAKPETTTFRPYDQPSEAGNQGPRLLDLGNPDARRWLTDHVDRLLTEQGIDLYRQDFNIDPLPFWQANDAPDRQGIHENHHVTGYLAYWDELRRRHPAMLIDSCASGGRRNDLETMRRSVPLWRSDYAYEPIGHQCMTYGLSLWLPYHGTGTVASVKAPYYGGGFTAVEPYAFWSNAAPSLGSGIDIRVREIDYEALRRLYRQWRDLSRFYYGDFYPLTPYSQSNDEWMAWQFHLPDSGEGAVQAFRRADCSSQELRLKLHDLEPTVDYLIRLFDQPGQQRLSGRALMNDGLAITLREKPGAAVAIYRRAP